MSKKVIFNKPNRAENAEAWIKDRIIDKNTTNIEKENTNIDKTEVSSSIIDNNKEKKDVEMKRITLDIPKHWHMRIKVICAEKGLKMNEEILPLLKKHFDLSN